MYFAFCHLWRSQQTPELSPNKRGLRTKSFVDSKDLLPNTPNTCHRKERQCEITRTEVSEGSGSDAAIATLGRGFSEARASLPGARYHANDENSRFSTRLAGTSSKLCDDAVNDWIEDVLRQLERIAFGHDVDRFAGGIVKHMTGTALGQMEFEFLSELGVFLAASRNPFELSKKLAHGCVDSLHNIV